MSKSDRCCLQINFRAELGEITLTRSLLALARGHHEVHEIYKLGNRSKIVEGMSRSIFVTLSSFPCSTVDSRKWPF